jgi:hypothetical protein
MMAWIAVRPATIGGGRQPKEPIAKLYKTGVFTLSFAAVALLGDPQRVHVQVEPELRRIRIQPATPHDVGAFSLAGGGNTPHRIGLRAVTRKFPELAGSYRVVRAAGGIECIQEAQNERN